MATDLDPVVRAVRAVMEYRGDDITSLASALGMSRASLSRRFNHWQGVELTSDDIRAIGELYDVDPLDLVRGIVPRLTPAKAGTHRYLQDLAVPA